MPSLQERKRFIFIISLRVALAQTRHKSSLGSTPGQIPRTIKQQVINCNKRLILLKKNFEKLL